MADMNNFGDIKESFEHINEVLDSMRAQNAMNANNSDKVLLNINKSLEELANEENSDLIKVYLAELKRSLEERHNFVSSKFSEIEDSFKTIVQKTENQLQASEIKEVFEIIATNLNNFSTDFSSQKDIISDISLKIEELKQDDSQKKDILRNIAVLKVELEKFSNGFESIILNLNNNFKETAQVLTKLDSSEALDGIKKDIDNVFLSSNAILSTLQVIDRKNRELEEVITHVVTREDFELEREQIAKLITQNIQISDYISSLPKQNQVENLTEKVDTAVGVINALKNMLNDTGKQNQQLLTAQLENLESKILNISSEEEFIGFRKELADFAKEITQSTNLMRADLDDTNAELKALVSFLSAMDIKASFENFAGLSKISETNVKESVSLATETISKEIEKNKSLTALDIAQSTSSVVEKIELTKKELAEGSKANQSGILEHLQSVISNIFSVKNALHIENAENAEAIDTKLEDLKENLVASNNYLVQHSDENLENIISNVEKVFQEINEVKEGLSESSSIQTQNLSSGFSHISKKIGEIKEELNQNSQDNFASLLSIVEDFSKEFSAIKESLEQSTAESSNEVKSVVAELSEKLGLLQGAIQNDFEISSNEIRSSIDSIIQTIKFLKNGIEQTASANFSELRSNVEELSQKLETVQENLSLKSESNITKLVSLFEDLSKEFDDHKAFLSESTQINFESVGLYIQNLNKRIEEAKNEFDDSLKGNIFELQSSISALPETIKENQVVFENEKKALLEENSRNITDLGDKIHNLVKGILSKDNPFKENILGEFVELKSALSLIKEDVAASNTEFSEHVEILVNESLQAVEDSITKYNEQYKQSLFGLQNNLKHYFDSAHASAQENDLKLDNSLKEASEIKTEIQSIIGLLGELKEDATLSEFAFSTSQKFEGILLNITQLEASFSAKTKDSLQNVLAALEGKFEVVSTDLKDYKEFTTTEINEFLSEIEDRIETIKTQVGLTSTDVLNSLNAKSNDIISSLSPISNSVEKLCSVNFEEIILDIKNKIDSSYFSITSAIKESAKAESAGQLEKISQEFEALSERFNETTNEMLSNNSDEFEELKSTLDSITLNVSDVLNTVNDKLEDEFFIENFNNIKTSIAGAKTQNKNALDDALKTLLGKLEEMNLSSDSFENTIAQTKSEFLEKLDGIKEDLADAQENTKSEILSEIIQSQIETKSAILSELQETSISIREDYNLSTKSAVKEAIGSTIEDSREKVFEKLDSVQGTLIDSQDITKKVLLEELSQAQDETKIAVLNELRKGQNDTQAAILDNLETNIAELKEKLVDAQGETLAAIIDNLETNIAEIKEGSSSSLASVGEKIELAIENTLEASREQVFEKLETIEDRFVEVQNSAKIAVLEGLEANVSTLQDNSTANNAVILQNIENALQIKLAASKEQVFGKLESLKGLFVETQNDTKTSLLESVESNIAALKENSESTHSTITEDIEISLENKLSDSKEQIFEKLEAVQNVFIDAQNDTKTALMDEFIQAQDETKIAIIKELNVAHSQTEATILEELSENIVFIKEALNTIAPGEELKEELSAKIEKLETAVNKATDALGDKLSDSQDANKASAQALLSEVKTSFYEKVDDSLDELRSFIEILEDKNDVSSSLDGLKSEVFEKFSEFSDSLEASIQAISVKEELDEVNKNLEESIDNLFNNIEEKFNSSLAQSDAITNLGEKSEEINRRIEELKKVVTEEITEKLDNFELNIDNKNQDFAAQIEEMKVSLEELKETYIDLSLNSNMEMSSALITVQEKVDQMSENLSALNIKDEINDNLAKGVESIHIKLDTLINVEPNTEVEDNIKEIKQIIESQSEFIEKIEQLERLEELGQLEKLSELDGLSMVKNEIQKALGEFNTKLEGLDTEEKEDSSQVIIDSLGEFKESLFENLIEIFNQVSFVEESEDIKDFIEEKTDEIKDEIREAISSQLHGISTDPNADYGGIGDIKAFVDITKKELRESLKSSLGNNFNDIISSLDILHEKTGSVDYNCNNLVNDIKEIKKNLLSGGATPSGEKNYDDSYTLLDVESDIAKIRLALKEISQAKENSGGFGNFSDFSDLSGLSNLGDLNKINEDLTSISTRTNKLLLNSDESYNVLKDNLNDFRNIVYKIDERIKHIDNSDKIKAIGSRVEDANKLILSCVNSDKIFNQTFMYLAEWIDKADEKLEKIEEKLSDVDDIKQSLNTIQKSMLTSSDLEMLFNNFSKKFDQQQAKMKAMEEKIEKLSKKAPAKSTKDTDLKLLVKEVLSQFDKPEKVNATLAKKVDNIDKQLATFGKSIEKITSYVD